MSSFDPTSRRDFLTRIASLAAISQVVPMALAQENKGATAAAAGGGAPFKLPPLGYDFAALEPHIDAQTMQIHHDKHHEAYVKNLNTALEGKNDLAGRSAEDLIRDLDSLPEAIRTAVRNNGGGHVNHTMFWDIMSPGGAKEPSGELAEAIKSSFGSLDEMKKKFNDAGAKRFGSGWVWVVRPKGGDKLEITSTANQDNPMMEGADPILGNDVWEHAYYLKYQNKRADYLTAWWNVVNWDKVAERFAKKA